MNTVMTVCRRFRDGIRLLHLVMNAVLARSNGLEPTENCQYSTAVGRCDWRAGWRGKGNACPAGRVEERSIAARQGKVAGSQPKSRRLLLGFRLAQKRGELLGSV